MTTSVRLAHFDMTNHPPVIVTSEFSRTSDGQLMHMMDDKLRAIIPPEGWDDYAKLWPACQPVVDSLKSPHADLSQAINDMLKTSAAAGLQGDTIIMPKQVDPTPAPEATQTPAPEVAPVTDATTQPSDNPQ